MPRGLPPTTPATPQFRTLPAGSMLWRVGRTPPPGAVRGARVFNRPRASGTTADDPRWGGRFDPPAQDGGFCYASLDELSAISEVLLRDLGWDGRRRYLPRRAVEGRCLMVLETRRPLTLITLTDLEDLAAVRQDTWLIHAEPSEFALTQKWGRWMRAAAVPDGGEAGQAVTRHGRLPGRAAGFIWPSKRNPGGRTLVLFKGVCGPGLIRSAFERPLDSGPGLDWLERRLRTLQTGFRRPDKPAAPLGET